eukprot:CAMPEP_0114340484 /NCGR_PEP_ID=MMETSP0101-20121206/8403_1 /TAXON_ID=38822 ORGANISM="Pteridomonas danica, Strain PT" /NCGR_SAMPLE_ID=MMETSP0101 /ASSEMBLY_ACC=CAM_ASM_000211 /LENGTH=241 /DNA_ID=CAMNT_0001473753 /DNA_START=1508 /DNA_END=2230 /DNA_ORIENTATION=-
MTPTAISSDSSITMKESHTAVHCLYLLLMFFKQKTFENNSMDFLLIYKNITENIKLKESIIQNIKKYKLLQRLLLFTPSEHHQNSHNDIGSGACYHGSTSSTDKTRLYVVHLLLYLFSSDISLQMKDLILFPHNNNHNDNNNLGRFKEFIPFFMSFSSQRIAETLANFPLNQSLVPLFEKKNYDSGDEVEEEKIANHRDDDDDENNDDNDDDEDDDDDEKWDQCIDLKNSNNNNMIYDVSW